MNPHPILLSQPVTSTDHILGPTSAAVTLVEYGDIECPNCKQAEQVINSIVETHHGRVRIVFRHFPLEGVHPHALLAAQAAEAAAAQKKFWPMLGLLFAHQTHLDLAHLRKYAEELELDIPQFVGAIDDEVYLQRVREQIDGGVRSGVRATPTFFVNGALFDVSFGMEGLVERVNSLAPH